MKRLLFTPAAQADLSDIWDYSAATWDMDQADLYIDAIRDVCLALADGRRPGLPVDVRPGYRKAPAGSHMIYYRDGGDHLAIVRVLHGRQDTGRHLA
ncbi:MAG: type II toxin-antitoxin system RelE/ParE family toxin [Pseudomonadota bacterium]|uniref:type II toxin-antitoxin system RelE/ParE family toxin n=1 Tax=Sphingobium yanoikuyae TaxID=13690 RepID=UPI00137803E2|nr:type II toxin-antitoxin system RelE/ParE family toxin [Sphingobium yanoikuyae]